MRWMWQYSHDNKFKACVCALYQTLYNGLLPSDSIEPQIPRIRSLILPNHDSIKTRFVHITHELKSYIYADKLKICVEKLLLRDEKANSTLIVFSSTENIESHYIPDDLFKVKKEIHRRFAIHFIIHFHLSLHLYKCITRYKMINQVS